MEPCLLVGGHISLVLILHCMTALIEKVLTDKGTRDEASLARWAAKNATEFTPWASDAA